MQQKMSSTFTMPDGSDSTPVVTVRNTGEGLIAWRDRHLAALAEAYATAYGL